jgi:membrane protease YdiL (CAAX protease family)
MKNQHQTDRLIGRAWSGPAIASLLLLLFSAYVVLAGLVQFVGLTDTQQLLFQTIGFHWFGLLFIAGHARALNTNWSVLYGLCGNAFGRLKQIVANYLGMIVVVIVGALGWGVLLKQLGIEAEMQDVATLILGAEPFALKIYLIFLAVVLAPVCEEFLFRGILFPSIARLTSVKTAALLVSLLFAGIHLYLPGFVPFALLSLCLCYAYWRTGSLWVNIGMHTLFNGINLAIMFRMAELQSV